MINNQARAWQKFGAWVTKIGRRDEIGAFDGNLFHKKVQYYSITILQ
jgi:hypothetical protein